MIERLIEIAAYAALGIAGAAAVVVIADSALRWWSAFNTLSALRRRDEGEE